MNEMFCFQCEQTAQCKGCTGRAGVCGKPAEVANLQDKLVGALIGIAGNRKADRLVITSLFATITNVDFDAAKIQELIDQVHVYGHNDYDMQDIWTAEEDIRSLKSLILFGIKGMAAYAYHAMVLGYSDETVTAYFHEALYALGTSWTAERLLPLVLKTGEVNLSCMAMLDKANTTTYGDPTPVVVPLTIEPGPFIVVSGHDLKDLQLLLEQTDGKGINVYTHGEMLPAHGYPLLKKHPQLKGNFGTAWQNQQKEFDGIPAPVLFTTNCLMPPRPSYADRVFTTEVVEYPSLVHIDERQGLLPGDRQGAGTGRIPGEAPDDRHQRRRYGDHRFRPGSRPFPGGEGGQAGQGWEDLPFLFGRRL
jgi:hydroxylamine reductase